MDSHEVRSHWAGRTGAYSPAYYAHHGPDARSEAVREALDRHVGSNASVLELGCSSGRHLAHLQAHGYDDLAGVDLNDDALEVMRETYPDLACAGTFYHGAIEDVVADVATDRFDAVYSVETLQHLHPAAEEAFAEIVRVTDDVLVTVENEGDADSDGSPGVASNGTEATSHEVNYVDDDLPLYYRDWGAVFKDLGLEQVEGRCGDRDTTRVFRVPEREQGR